MAASHFKHETIASQTRTKALEENNHEYDRKKALILGIANKPGITCRKCSQSARRGTGISQPLWPRGASIAEELRLDQVFNTI